MFPHVILCLSLLWCRKISVYKVIISEKRHKLEAQNMDMILVTFCADNLGMMVKVKFEW